MLASSHKVVAWRAVASVARFAHTPLDVFSSPHTQEFAAVVPVAIFPVHTEAGASATIQ